jgi:hypothetical protein
MIFLMDEIAVDGKVYIKIQKGIYGLSQAGTLANKLLQRRLDLDGYRPTEDVHGLWKHETRTITLSLVVDDFGIKYVGAEHYEHLKACIENHYEISCDCTGSAYCGLKLDWDYEKNLFHLSMPGYIKASLHKFQRPDPMRPENVPHIWNPPVYEKNKNH